MRFGKGLSTFKKCTMTEGKHNNEMEAKNAYGKGTYGKKRGRPPKKKKKSKNKNKKKKKK